MPVGSGRGPARSASTSQPSGRCWARCRTSRSRRAGSSPCGSTATATISVRTNRYSVPVRLIGRTVRAMLHASEPVVHDGRSNVTGDPGPGSDRCAGRRGQGGERRVHEAADQGRARGRPRWRPRRRPRPPWADPLWPSV
ncbi:Mu transposase domain-containing protein [Streptomyces sp. NPDC054958]